MTDYSHKSTPKEIRTRFDQDVDRFSNLETGQSATLDAPLVLDLLTEVAARTSSKRPRVLDIGCGAGNFSVRLSEKKPFPNATLIDLSRPMLDRAQERLGAAGVSLIHTLQGDIREIDLPPDSHDVVFATAVLHHLRGQEEWERVFAKVYSTLAPGGCFLVSDLVEHDHPTVQALLWKRYGDYLAGLKGEEYRDSVFSYIDKEDTPRSLGFQIEVLKRAGFDPIEVLHKNACFAAFVGFKQPIPEKS